MNFSQKVTLFLYATRTCLFAILITIGNLAYSQTFPCDHGQKLYFFRDTGNTNGYLSYIENYTSGSPDIVEMCPLPTNAHNALAANPTDGYLYYLNSNVLTRLSSTCVATPVCTLGFTSLYGGFDPQGGYWTVNSSNDLVCIDISTCNIVKGPFPVSPGGGIDISFSPFDCYIYVGTNRYDTAGIIDAGYSGINFLPSGTYGGTAIGDDGNLYGLAGNGTQGNLSVINLTTNTSSNIFDFSPGPTFGKSDMTSFPCFSIDASFSFSQSVPGCVPTAINFTNTSTGDALGYNWNFGDTASLSSDTSSALNPSHTYTTPGNYTVTLIASIAQSSCLASMYRDTTMLTFSILPCSTSCSATVTATAASCNGATDGLATVTPISGTPPYTYLWSSGGIAATEPNLAAGTYSVNVTDSLGCSTTASATVTQPTALTATVTASGASCNAATDGSATVIATGGISPYTYLWSSGGITDTESNLVAGTYSVTITDSLGCSITASDTVTEPTALTANITTTEASCNAAIDGSATVTATGGIPPYTYLWSSGGNAATESNIIAGTYSLTITDSSGCTATANATVNQPTVLTANINATDASCFGAADGIAIVTVNGGTSPYTYLWSSGGNTATESNLAAGTYTITVTDNHSCSSTATVIIFQPSAALSAFISGTTPTICGSTTGTATVSATGGTPGYTYNWAPSGGTASTAPDLVAGTYTVTITDTHLCTTTAIATVNSLAGATVAITSQINVLCFGATTGSATASANGGSGPYDYVWTGSSGTLQTTNNITIPNTVNGLVAGSYTVTVTDNNACTSTAIVSITQPLAGITATVTTVPSNCRSNDGSATVTASGGTGSLTYSWSGGGSTNSSLYNIGLGTYTVTVTDSNACTQIATGTVTSLGGPIASAGADVIIVSGGSTQLSATGGGSGETYNWTPATGLSCSTCPNPTASPSITTDYCVTITNLGSCIDSACVRVTVELPCPDDFSVPNAFSSNNDGHNDVFELKGWNNCIAKFNIIIYDRWGEKVFDSISPSISWDGNYKGKPVNSGVYVYYIMATLINGEKIIKKGNISLIR